MSYQVQQSEEIDLRHIKILLWGAKGSRKTELVLRNFPHVLLIDSEGNSEMCVGMKEIPPFARIQTKDPKIALEVVNDAAAGKIKVKGHKVETLCFDSTSILWAVQSEVANSLAEKRQLKYNKPVEEAIVTPLDWGIAKRPIKKLYIAANNSPFPFLIFISREKDKADENDKNKKDGFIWDSMKGIDYEVNLGLHLDYDAAGKWRYTVTKVQGILGNLFPMNATSSKFPIAELLEMGKVLKASVGTEEEEAEIASAQTDAEMAPPPVRDLKAFAAFAKLTYNFDGKKTGDILKAAGFTTFSPEVWDRAVSALANHAAQNQ